MPSVARQRVQSSLMAVAAVIMTACGSSPRQSTAGAPTGQQTFGAETSEAAVRTFLDAAAVDDYPRMWAVFGTENGAVVHEYGVQEIEPRMIVLAGLLRNSGYEMRVANLATYGPKRIRYVVQLRNTRAGNVSLPVLTVPDGSGRWFVEQFDMARLTETSGP